MTCKRLYRFGKTAARRGACFLLFAGIAAVSSAPANAAPAQNSGAGTAKAQAKASENANAPAQTYAELAKQIREIAREEQATAARRESAARRKLEQEQALVRQATARRNAAIAHSNALRKQFNDNNKHIDQLNDELTQRKGDLGELFGVVRVTAAEASKKLQDSLLSTQFAPPPGEKERSAFLQLLAQSKSLPSIPKLQRMWFEILREIVGEGKVVRYRTNVLQIGEGGKPTRTAAPTEVVRVGPFTAVSGDEYLAYLSTVESLTQLYGSLPGSYRNIAGNLMNTPPGSGYTKAVVDIARGGLLHRYLQRPSWLERVQLGQAVGYIIIAVGVIGVLVALFQFTFLLNTRFAVKAQLRDLSKPKLDNPLGRLLLTFEGEAAQPESADVVALRLHEAVQKEVPRLERFQGFLRVAVAIGPLLGLIGTVTGMIITFHAIVASGGGDPTVMATGIGHAMIATVLGLGVAIPLLFINMGLTAFSHTITQTLDEFSTALLADQMKGSKGHGAGALLGGQGEPYRPSR
ncbi:MAG TPA: MotA/TolQ/ExbB proton channel family protein [Gammaproteobacteria bacterium]|jgi:biopolymer transport protein ExbB|nr:MotA/TolQ/ExbB proton channel family protein [Gammaproteobacteria bacterium]